MRGYEVIFKFPMISFKIPLESRFSRDPFIVSFIPPPPPYGYPTYLVSMERYFQAASGRGSFLARGSFFTKHVGIYRNTASITYYQYPCFPPEITPIRTSPLSTLQVLQQFLIDSGSIGEGFEVEIYVSLVGFQGYSHLLYSLKYFMWLV